PPAPAPAGGAVRSPAVAPAPVASAAAPLAEPTPAPAPLTPAKIAARIAELEAARKKGSGADPDGTLALELALLYIHPDNPATDHAKALATLRAYLAASPPGSRNPLIGHIVGLLEDIEQLGRIARDARKREKEADARAQALEQSVAEDEAAAKKREQDLQAQIQTLQQRIEQLQLLDLEMEKRRRSVK
ncbi:MAG TPA: hypothetical protein VI078_08860, partial [bacterium]